MKSWNVTVQTVIKIRANTEQDMQKILKSLKPKSVCICDVNYGSIRSNGVQKVVSIDETDKWSDIEIDDTGGKSLGEERLSAKDLLDSELKVLEDSYKITSEDFRKDNYDFDTVEDEDKLYWRNLLILKEKC